MVDIVGETELINMMYLPFLDKILTNIASF